MPVIDERHELAELLRGCAACYEVFCENSSTITDDYGNLSDEQVPNVLKLMNDVHRHQHVH